MDTVTDEPVTVTADLCSVCGWHDITVRTRTVGGQPWLLCDGCRSQIKPVRSHRVTDTDRRKARK